MIENQGVKLVPFRRETKLTRYLALPKELLKLNISPTAMVVYALLLDRANLSQKNSWTDEKGRVYVHFAFESIAMYMGFSEATARRALKELEKQELIYKVPTGYMKPYQIYLRIPTDSVDNLVENIRAESA